MTVIRTNGLAGDASVDYATADGTASNGVDYTATSGTLTWTNNDAAAKQIEVPILVGPGAQPARYFTLDLSNPVGVGLGVPRPAR
jgi:hypothetical protein